MARGPLTVDAYLADLSDDKRAALEKVRRAIKAAAPKAEECISYRLPAFHLNGRTLVAYGATASHCAPVRRSPRNSSPQNAAMAGSRLIRMPKVFAGSARSAFISSV